MSEIPSHRDLAAKRQRERVAKVQAEWQKVRQPIPASAYRSIDPRNPDAVIEGE